MVINGKEKKFSEEKYVYVEEKDVLISLYIGIHTSIYVVL